MIIMHIYFVKMIPDLQENILEFLDYRYIIQSLTFVCRQLYAILSRPTLWHRIGDNQTVQLPSDNTDIDWETMIATASRCQFSSVRVDSMMNMTVLYRLLDVI